MRMDLREWPYVEPPLGQHPETDAIYELATLFLGGKGYWYCTARGCQCWHEDVGEGSPYQERWAAPLGGNRYD